MLLYVSKFCCGLVVNDHAKFAWTRKHDKRRVDRRCGMCGCGVWNSEWSELWFGVFVCE
jgi:hypothetical protein